jgi:hypothetical protein
MVRDTIRPVDQVGVTLSARVGCASQSRNAQRTRRSSACQTDGGLPGASFRARSSANSQVMGTITPNRPESPGWTRGTRRRDQAVRRGRRSEDAGPADRRPDRAGAYPEDRGRTASTSTGSTTRSGSSRALRDRSGDLRADGEGDLRPRSLLATKAEGRAPGLPPAGHLLCLPGLLVAWSRRHRGWAPGAGPSPIAIGDHPLQPATENGLPRPPRGRADRSPRAPD